MKSLAIILTLIVSAFSLAAPPSTQPVSPFVVVMIDFGNLSSLGRFPFDRSVYAKAINRAADEHARAVVLKFFFDVPRSDAGDRALADSMSRIKVLLEARIDDTALNPNNLPARFNLPITSPDTATHAISGTSGWLPLPILSANAADIGFVDTPAGADRVPMIEQYRGHYVKSLWTSCLELATNQPATIIPGKSFHLAGKSLPLDDNSALPVQYPARDDLQYISLSAFLKPANHYDLRDRIIIIGWDADSTGAIQTPLGQLTPHRAFCYILFSLWDQLQRTPTTP